MNESRRKLIKLLPLAAVAGVSMTVAGKNVEAIEVKSGKRYIMKVDPEEHELTHEDLQSLQQTLASKGFEDCLVVSGHVEFYEMS